MESELTEAASPQEVEEEPAALREDPGAPVEEAGSQEVDGDVNTEVRVDDEVREPDYGAIQGETSGLVDPRVSSSSGQRPVPDALGEDLESGPGFSEATVEMRLPELEMSGPAPRSESRERRVEDVGQVARSLAYMTSLVTTLVGRMDRVEQAQSSSASGRRTTTATSARMETPMGGTPEAGALGWVDLNRLDAHMAQMRLADPGEFRPLTSMDRIMDGTFSSDDTETAARRAAQGELQVHGRGVPGALLGPLAEPLGPVMLAGRPGDDFAGRTFLGRNPLSAPLQSSQLSGMPQGTALQSSQLSGMPQGTALQSSQLPGMPQGTALQSSQLPSMPQGTALQSSQLSGMPQGTALQSSQLPSVPQGTALQSSQLPSMPQGTALQSSQLSGMPQGTTMQTSPLQSTLQGGVASLLPLQDGSMELVQPPPVQEQCSPSETSVRALLPQGPSISGQEGGSQREAVRNDGNGSGVVPPGLPVRRGQGLVMGAPENGLVYAEGAWRPYAMVQGQMVIQNLEATGASVVGLSLAAPTYHPSVPPVGPGPIVPPPPPLPPSSPRTPLRRSTPGFNANATPGGTPVPPPPPPTPVTTTGASIGGSASQWEVEEPSKLVTKLPALVATKGQDAAVVAGDWLAQLEPSMSSLSSSAASWWQALMGRVRVLYTRWLESTPILRLQIRQEVLNQRPPVDRYQRVEQRASMLLLDSLPEDLRAEVVSVRAVTVEAMVFLVHCSFQPGGSAEQAYLLQFLTAPETGNSVDAALTLARKWVRLLRRGKELQVVLPDPSLLCRGLDKLHGGVFAGNRHPSAAFRIASFKLERQLDYKAMANDVEDYAQLILGELEAALLSQPLAPPTKLNRLEEATADAGKGKAKGKSKQPCWAWTDGSGCKYGQNCLFRHDPLGNGRCWTCGSSTHLKPQCPFHGQGGNGLSANGLSSSTSTAATVGSGNGNGAQNSAATSSATTDGKGSGEDKPPRRPRKKGGGKAKDAVRKAEESAQAEGGTTTPASTQPPTTTAPPTSTTSTAESARDDFFEEAAKALKSLRLAKAALERVCVAGPGGRRALVDSGATTSMRTAGPRGVAGLPVRRVLLAEGEANFYQLPGGTLVTERPTAPILAMSDLMEIGCRVLWSSGEGCRITHPVRGDLPTSVVNGCPELEEKLGLELIDEAEAIKLRRREAEIMVNKLVLSGQPEAKLDWSLGAKAVADLRNGVGAAWAWLHRAFPEAPAWLVSAVPVVASMDGARVPWNRRERKRWKQAAAVAVHLFCGKERGAWKSRAEAAHVITVDQAEDLMADDTYAALLDLALTGKVKMVFGGPPCRTYSVLRYGAEDGDGGPRPLRDRHGDGRWGRDNLSEWEQWRVKQDTIMVFRMLFLWMVAAVVARGRGDREPDFLMEHPEDPKNFVKDVEPASLWATPEIRFLERVLGWSAWEFDQGPLGHVRRKPTRVLSSVPCPRELLGVRGPSTVSAEERDHDGAGFRSVTWAAWAPQLKVVIKDIVETSLAGATLDRVMKLDASFLEHLRRDHMPYRRDCRACLAGAFRGHMHRRIVAPEAWCLSLDVIGPARQGQDEYIKKVKYGLIGTLVVPDALGKLLQPADPDGEPDDGAGVGPVEAVDPFDQEAEADDEGEAGPSAEAARNMEKWQALVDKEKLEGVSVVEVPFFVSLSSKKSLEVLGAVKEMLLQVRRLGLVVRRIHTDREGVREQGPQGTMP